MFQLLVDWDLLQNISAKSGVGEKDEKIWQNIEAF